MVCDYWLYVLFKKFPRFAAIVRRIDLSSNVVQEEDFRTALKMAGIVSLIFLCRLRLIGIKDKDLILCLIVV